MADKHPANQPEETTVLYQNIKAICDERNLSIAKIAKNAGVSADTLEISLDKLFDRQSISEGDNHISEIMYSLKDLRLNEKSTAAIIKIAKIIALSMTEPED